MENKNGQYVGVDDKYIPEEEKYVDNSTNSEIQDTINQGFNAVNNYIKDKDNQEKMKNAGKKGLKIAKGIGIGYLVYIGIVFVIAIAIIIMVFIFIFKGFNQFDKVNNGGNEIIDKANNAINEGISSQKISRFNSDLEMYNGTEFGSQVSELLSKVAMKIKKDSTHSISVVYGNTTTSNPDEIISLKSNFEAWTKYEVTFDYNNNGYINKVTILNNQ